MESLKTRLFELNIFDGVTANYRLHFHENICICAISEGEMLFFHDEEDILLTPGKIIVFNAYQPHMLKKYKDVKKYHILHIYEDAFLAPKIIDSDATCRGFFSFCQDVLMGRNSSFIDIFLEKNQIKNSSLAFKNTLLKIKKYIDENIEINISLENLAKKANLNSSYLSRSFKKEFGLPLSRYILNTRVHRSKEMLDNGEDITQIALKLGFCDQAHFYKAFKSIFAITPNEYKNIKRVKTLSDCRH